MTKANPVQPSRRLKRSWLNCLRSCSEPPAQYFKYMVQDYVLGMESTPERFVAELRAGIAALDELAAEQKVQP